MIFVDTSAWFEAGARQTSAAKRTRQALADAPPSELVTSDAVLVELWNVLSARGYGHIATPLTRDVAASTTVLESGADERDQAMGLLGEWPDQDFSYADALAFVLMERHGIARVATLDRHFVVYRYGRRRKQAFTVLPA